MTTETTRLRELLQEFARDYQDCRDRLGKPEIALDGFETFLASNPESPFAEAVRQRDEGIELLRSVEEVWEDLTGRCDEDCDCVVHAIRAFLSNFPEEAPAVAYTEKERE